MAKFKKDKDDEKPVKTQGDGSSKSVESAIKEIQDKYGEGSIMKLGEGRRVDVDVIPTGSISIDLALGVGGVPRGRVTEIYGPESSGKTTLCLHLVAEMQKKGGVCAYVDAEHALDPEYAKRIGVKINDLLISQPDTGEQGLEIVETLVRSGGVALVVVDSVAALTPRAEIEGEMDQQHMGLQARLMSHALRKLTGIISKTIIRKRLMPRINVWLKDKRITQQPKNVISGFTIFLPATNTTIMTNKSAKSIRHIIASCPGWSASWINWKNPLIGNTILWYQYSF